MNAGGDGRQCLVSRNQIDISPDLIFRRIQPSGVLTP